MVDKIANVLRLVAVDQRAGKAGLYKSMTLADARAQFEKLDIAFASPRQDSILLERLADWCDRYTPLVALDGSEGLVLDITGCVHLFADEATLLNDIHFRLKKHGMFVRSAIANNAASARAFARYSSGGIVGDDEEKRLHKLYLACLEIDQVHLAGLKRAGLLHVGEVEVLPRAALSARFGKDLVNRLDNLFGRQNQPISPRRIVPVCMVERRMAEPLISMDSVELLLQSLGDELFRQLQTRVEGAREVEASFFRVDGNVRRINIEAGKPLTEIKTLMRLLKERLSTLADPLDAGFGFDIIRMSAVRTERTRTQQKSLDNTQQETETFDALIDRLSIRLGNSRVLRPIPVDTHIPERAVMLESASREKSDSLVDWSPEHQPGNPPERPIRLFNPPELIETTAGIPDGAPARFMWRRVQHTIVLAEGPERIAPEWWREHAGALTRDYYRVEDRQGKRFWVFREGLYERNDPNPKWFLHGLFA
ncbi:DNA polymerase Y family protein [Phyllobacterium sp. YR531]|uniref:Y-family DNA polymerase n=1 Tax=Phyllobacterium sp. YR531 TaxID=1144343 RepID=UPI00031D9ED7|nr:DNA polymerase Y family protein [Phyllobacterium sp. YR531]